MLLTEFSANSFTGTRVASYCSKELQNSIYFKIQFSSALIKLASSLSIKSPKFDSQKSKAIPIFIPFLTLEMSDNKYQLSTNIFQLTGLILLQCC